VHIKEMTMSGKLIEAIAEMREDEAIALSKQMLESGVDPLAILGEARQAMDIVGQRSVHAP